MTYHSQDPPGQDRWAHAKIGDKQDGTFLDIGCWHWKRINNSLFFEESLGWSGWAIDKDPDFQLDWLEYRGDSRFICADATIGCDAAVNDYQPGCVDNDQSAASSAHILAAVVSAAAAARVYRRSRIPVDWTSFRRRS